MKNTPAFLVAVFSLAALPTVHAQVNINSTATSAGSYDWTLGTTWNGGTVPDSAGERAVLNPATGTPSGNISFTGVNGLTLAGIVNNTADPGAFTVNYTVGTSSDTITLSNSASPTRANIGTVVDAGNLTINSKLVLNDPDGVTFSAAGAASTAVLTINGDISGNSTIFKEGSLPAFLGGNNSFSGGITFAAGANRGLLTATTTNAFRNTSGTITFATVSTHSGGIGTLASNGTTVVNNTLDLANTASATANASFRVGGTGSVLELAGNIVNATGATPISVGRTVNPNGSAPSGGGTVKFSGTGYTVAKNVVFNDVNSSLEFAPSSGVQNWSGNISGTTGDTYLVTKSGAGTTVLSGTNTYDRQTIVSGGTLILNGTNQNATAVTFGYGYQQSGTNVTGHWQVESGGTLGGTGTIAGRTANNANVTNAIAVLVKDGGKISPGDSTQANPVGKLIISTTDMANPGTQRGLVLLSGARLDYQVAGDGLTTDLLQFNGFAANNTESTLTFNSNVIDLGLWGSAVDGTYNLDIMSFFSDSGTTAVTHGFSSGLSLNILNPNITSATIDWDGVNNLGTSIGLNFTITAVPEPTAVTAAALLVGMFGWSAWHRRRQRSKNG